MRVIGAIICSAVFFVGGIAILFGAGLVIGVIALFAYALSALF